MSSRWSYGPEGLRERPVARWSDAELLPRWRDLQPVLIRSAGVVGIVATIMAVVSSDALRFGGETPHRGGSGLGAADAPVTPVVAAASELRAEGPAAPAAGIPIKVVSVRKADPQIAAVAPPPPPAELTVADLRRERAPAPAAPAEAPLTTASVSAARDAAGTSVATMVAIAHAPPAEMSLTALAPSDAPADGTDVDTFAWPEGAEACPRDWVAAHDLVGNSPDCTATEALIAMAAVDQSALQDVVTEQAQVLAAMMPRIPIARPEPPADFKPTAPHTRRVSSRNSSWPDEPPPNCAAGQHAKWRFVDRKAGTKAWYCR